MNAEAGPEHDARWMRVALGLGRRAQGRTWPNPAVGCVIVDADGRVIGQGWTRAGGRPHAEAEALAQARAHAAGRLPGATAYVTLEPCAHHGRTPPCADALIAAGLARVVSALEDPDPRVAGRGHARLRAAGMAVTVGVGAEAARADHLGHLSRQRLGRPCLTLKLAASIDGRIATAAGESRWISAEPARARVHLMRASHDVVLIGGATARADDPALDVRLPGLEASSPVAAVLDPRLELAPESRLARGARTRPLWLLHGPRASADARAEAIGFGAEPLAVAERPDGALDLADALRVLGGRGVTRVLCEGGGRLGAALLVAGLVDRLVLTTSGLALGADAVAALGALGLARLAEAPRLRLERAEAVGPDVWSEWVASPSESAAGSAAEAG